MVAKTKKNANLPKPGDRIPVEKFHISELNVRADEPFGESEEDKILIQQMRRGKVVQPFKARPEGDGFGIIVGRRRFLAKKYVGTKEFVVGTDVLIQPMSDDEAREASLIENLQILRKGMNPIARAKQLNEILVRSPAGLRGTAIRLGISATSLSEWLKILELSPKMQDVVAKGLLNYTDALHIARMKLGTEFQDELAEILEKEGIEAFKKELSRVATGKMKRGIPKDVYIILRTTFDKRYPPDLTLYEKLSKLAEKKKMKVDAYAKWVLAEHVKSAK